MTCLTIEDDFGLIDPITVDADGVLYIGDVLNQEIRAYTPDGTLLSRWGRKGDGPGEFQGLRDLQTRGDTVFAFDIRLDRISAFIESDSYSIYTLNLPVYTPQVPNYGFLAPSTGGFVVQYEIPERARQPSNRRSSYIVLKWISANGKLLRDSIAVVPDNESLFLTHPQYGYSIGPLPYGRRSIFRLGPADRLYIGRTDSISVSLLDLYGNQLRVASVRRPTQDRTARDIQLLYESYEEQEGDLARFAVERVEEALERGLVPTSKPKFSDFQVDGQGRVWFELITSRHRLASTDLGLQYVSTPPGETVLSDRPLSEWLVLDPMTNASVSVQVDADVDIGLIRRDFAYAIENSAYGTQSIVVYEIVGAAEKPSCKVAS